MGPFRRTPAAALPRKAIVAAATRIALDGSGWKNWKFGDQKWQEEAWRHYDICGELRYGANWIGNALSRCRLYVADVDEAGRPGEECSEPDIQEIAETMFGGPAGRAEAQRALGINLTVAGEGYVVAESVADAKQDIWYVASPSEVRRHSDRIIVSRSNVYGGGKRQLDEKKDLLIRVWTPHPRQHDLADSAVRAVLPILREIEQLTKHVFAQIDSRLAGAGLLLLPDGIDFPRGDDDPPGLQGFMEVLTRTMGAALQSREDASSLVPVMATVPPDAVDKIKHLTFDTKLTTDAKDLRQEAIRRMALGLDMPPEVLLGQGDVNHWSAWQIEESSVKIHVVPVLARIADALTTAYLVPALEIQGLDPDKYTFWYDTSPLTQRPDRQADALSLYNLGLLSDDAMRAAGNWGDDDAPDEKEQQRRLAIELIRASPALLADPMLVELAGLPAGITGTAPPPPVDPNIDPNTGLPYDTGAAPTEPGPPALPAGTEATPAQDGLVAALEVGADMVVRRAMELAGKRLLTRAARTAGACQATPAHLLHTQLKVLSYTHADTLLAGAFDHVPALAQRVGADSDRLVNALRVYCTELLLRAAPHEPDALSMWLNMMMEGGIRA